MKKKLLPFLLTAVLLTLSLPSVPAEAASASDGVMTMRAVLVGNTYAGTEAELQGIEDCVASMKDMLTTLKNPYEQVVIDMDGSKRDMQRAVKQVFSKADADDLTLFYYNGHGAVAAKDSYTSDDYYDGALYFISKNQRSPEYYPVSELKQFFDQFQGKKALIIDACGSGAFVQKQGEAAEGSIGNEPHLIRDDLETEGFEKSFASIFSDGKYVLEDEALPKKMSGEFRDSDYYLLCGTKKGEYSYSVPVLKDGEYYYGGALTIGILKGAGYEYLTGWTDTMPGDTDFDGRISLQESYAYSRKVVDEVLFKPFGLVQNVVCYPSKSSQVLFDNNEPKPETEPEPEPEPEPDPVPVYRLYDRNTSEHFLTKDEAERSYLLTLGWEDEGTAFFGNITGTEEEAIYRLYNKNGGEHIYTRDLNEKNALLDIGWSDEGIAWYSPDEKGTTPVHRLYNNSLGRHLFTADLSEVIVLVISGWSYEGIPFGSPK